MNYTKDDIIKNDKVPLYKGKLYPIIPFSENDIYIITTIGDRLDLLAKTYYKDVKYWRIIAIANDNISNDSLFPPPGTQLRIPSDLSKIQNSYNKLNSLR